MFRALPCISLGLLLLGSCQNRSDDGLPCNRDDDCVELCSRIGECVSADSVIEVRLSWTVSGQAPSPTSAGICGAIDALEVSFESDSLRDEAVTYYPVPCELGRVYYDKMPERLARVQVSAVDNSGSILDVVIRNIESRSSDLIVDLNP